MNILVKVLVGFASIASIGFGVWHFFVPGVWKWYSYIDPNATELIVAVRAINVFFSLSLILFGVVNLQFIFGGNANRFSIIALLAASCILWLTRLAFQVIYPQGALCLTMSAFDTLPEKTFEQIMPGVMTLFTRKGWLKLLWGIVFLPIGFTIQAIALLKTHTLSPWQSILFLIGALLMATPDGVEIINLSASIMMAVSLVPYGLQIIASAL